MIDHVSVPIRDIAAAARFYAAVLEPLGLRQLVDRTVSVGFGKLYPEFWLNSRPELVPVAGSGAHVCLRAPDEAAVRAFHAAAIEHGATDDGAPGPREAAMTTYFGAFIVDPDGNRIEALTFPKQL